MHKILLLSQLLQKSIYFHVHWWKACLKIQTAGLGISISRNSNNLIAKLKPGRCVSHFNQKYRVLWSTTLALKSVGGAYNRNN